MGDPLSVAGSVVGLISLGIQVSQSLISFYTAYKDQNSDISKTIRRLENLQDTLDP